MKTYSVMNGEPQYYEFKKAYWFTCCDCGLSHMVVFEQKGKNKISYVVYRDDWETLKNRERMSNERLDWLIKTLQAEKRRRKKLKKEGKNVSES